MTFPPVNRNIKIGAAIAVALVAAALLSGTLFLSNTPRLNLPFITGLPGKTGSLIASFLKERPVTPTALPLIPTAVPPSGQPENMPTALPPTATPPPTSRPTAKPTAEPTRRPTPTPTTAVSQNCPAASNKTYSSMRVSLSDPEKLKGDLSKHPEVNLYLRGYGEVNEGKNLISRGGNQYGLDDKMPPQISSLFGTEYPKIIKTYIVYEWDFQNSRSLKPKSATPNYPVHILGLETTPGEPLLGLKAGRDIGGGNVFLLLYATKNYVLFTHSSSDNIFDGYLFYFFDFCVDPNLLAAYERDVQNGRSELPVIAPGQVFGYGHGGDVKVVVRDTMSFMDTRYREDWWEYGK